ncbi:MAG: transposase [Myxococcaceae bacterium]
MHKVRFVGLDVHQDTITMAVADADGTAPSVVGTFSSDIPRLVKQLKKLGPASNLRCCYEAGAGGFVLERALTKEGITCIIVAPSLVPTKQSGERVKTDKRDAVRLARFLRSGDLVAIHVPDEETEAMRILPAPGSTQCRLSYALGSSCRVFSCATVGATKARGRTRLHS